MLYPSISEFVENYQILEMDKLPSCFICFCLRSNDPVRPSFYALKKGIWNMVSLCSLHWYCLCFDFADTRPDQHTRQVIDQLDTHVRTGCCMWLLGPGWCEWGFHEYYRRSRRRAISYFETVPRYWLQSTRVWSSIELPTVRLWEILAVHPLRLVEGCSSLYPQ